MYPNFRFKGLGDCRNQSGQTYYSLSSVTVGSISACKTHCAKFGGDADLIGLETFEHSGRWLGLHACRCLKNNRDRTLRYPHGRGLFADGPITGTSGDQYVRCYYNSRFVAVQDDNNWLPSLEKQDTERESGWDEPEDVPNDAMPAIRAAGNAKLATDTGQPKAA